MKKSKQILNEVELGYLIKGFVIKMRKLTYADEYIGTLLAVILDSLDIEI